MSNLTYPNELKYHKEHTWLRIESDGTATIGISDYAQDQLGEVAYVDLPEVGKTVVAGKDFGTVESIKAVNALFSPTDGEVIAVNDELSDTPTLVNASPYGDGWIIKVKLTDTPDISQLLSADDYQKGL